MSLESVTIAENVGLDGIFVDGGSLSTSGSIIDDRVHGLLHRPDHLRRPQRRQRRLVRPQRAVRPAVDRRAARPAGRQRRSHPHPPARRRPAPRSTPSRRARPACARRRPRPTEQRRAPTDRAGCDIGSVEVDTSAPLSLVVDSALDAPDAVAGDGVCDDGTGHCTLRAAIDETNLALSTTRSSSPRGSTRRCRSPAPTRTPTPPATSTSSGRVTHPRRRSHPRRRRRSTGRSPCSAGPVSIDHLTVTHGRAEETGGGVLTLRADHPRPRDARPTTTLFGFDTAGAASAGSVRRPSWTRRSRATRRARRAASSSRAGTTIVRTSFTGNTSHRLRSDRLPRGRR